MMPQRIRGLSGSAAFLLISGALLLTSPLRAQEHTFAIEISGALCGYVDLEAIASPDDGTTVVRQTVFVMLSALGSEFNSEVRSEYHLDSATDRVLSAEVRISQGDVEFLVELNLDGDRARFSYPLDHEEKVVELPADVIVENPLRARHLLRDFVDRGAESVTYPMLELREAEVQPITYTLVDRATVELGGTRFETVVLDRHNDVTGLTLRQWVDVGTGMMVKLTIPGDREVYLADPSVKKRIAVANIDATIAKKVDVSIPDVHAISYMKVRAVLEPTGLLLDRADLNVPGQRFEGTVVGNRVEGVFTVEHPRYEGAGAPAFPVEATAELAEFLAPEDLIESDDPALVAHARRLTEGATDSWDASCRLSRWVADNISYAIPGGVTAAKTFEIRAGECGAHSLLLTALCRAVGIPSRVVWGCMYIPNFGGAFGQHAWTEVHMGDAGWIPVDSTANEADFVDSGHLRVGIYQSLSTAINMQEMEVLEHRLLQVDDAGAAEEGLRLDEYVGTYDHPAGEEPFEVVIADGGLAVDIPGQVVLGLRGPDEKGRWCAKLTSRVYCTFPRDEDGAVAALTIHETVEMRRTADPDEVGAEVPGELRDYLGTYRFAAIRADFRVVFDDGQLAVYDPTADRVVHLQPTDEAGRWIDEFGKNHMSFRVEDGVVRALLLDAANRFERSRDEVSDEALDAAAQVRAMLTDLHRAAADADAERLFGHIAADAVLLGTDARERWPVDLFRALAKPKLDGGEGWSSLPVEQHVFLSASGDIAWFDERLESAAYGPMRCTGVARKTASGWQVVHLNTTFPVPNEMFRKLVEQIAALPEPIAPPLAAVPATLAEAEVRVALTGLHLAASRSDREAYFAAFAADGIYFGTDGAERFTLPEFEAFCAPVFDAGQGWTTMPTEQHVRIAADGDFAWFDERLQSSKFGELRGSGVLVRRDGAWKIAQYHLSLPVPNEMVPAFTSARRVFDEQK